MKKTRVQKLKLKSQKLVFIKENLIAKANLTASNTSSRMYKTNKPWRCKLYC